MRGKGQLPSVIVAGGKRYVISEMTEVAVQRSFFSRKALRRSKNGNWLLTVEDGFFPVGKLWSVVPYSALNAKARLENWQELDALAAYFGEPEEA